jgi:hypothetical protein
MQDRMSYLASLPGRRGMVLLFLALLSLGGTGKAAWANGVPVQVFLDYLPFKSTWIPASGGRGVAVVSANDEQVQVNIQSMPEPPAGTVYYAWLEHVDGGYIGVGPLGYRSDGTASTNRSVPGLPYSENFSWVLVSVEPAGELGEAPSADIALAGRLPNPVALPEPVGEPPQLLPVTGASPTIFLDWLAHLWQQLLERL